MEVPSAHRQTSTAVFVAPQEDFAAAAGDHAGFRKTSLASGTGVHLTDVLNLSAVSGEPNKIYIEMLSFFCPSAGGQS